jgi:lysyl-tRNA synthetase class 2
VSEQGDDWRPSASIDVLAERANGLRSIRAYFAGEGVLEVDTPVLSRTTVTDPAIESLRLAGAAVRYLQTSPEYQMKRLLAAGAPSIVRIGPVFRGEESGRLHNPEFTMVEWYRLGFDLTALMTDVERVVDVVLGPGAYTRMSYRQLLRDRAGVDPFRASAADLRRALPRNGIELSDAAEVDAHALLDLLASNAITGIGDGRLFVTDYPADQAALARISNDADGNAVAARFELMIHGVEVANGYDELLDADALRMRMITDRAVRARDGRHAPEADERLLAAMRHGMPACAGVALGFDRLLMLKLGFERIDAVLPFSHARA